MFQSVALSIPFLIIVGGTTLFLHLVHRGLDVRAESYEKTSARIWLITGAVLLIIGPVAHGFLELLEHSSLSEDAITGGWMLFGMFWLLIDWERTWDRLKEYGPKWGQSIYCGALLLKFVTSGVVLTSYLFLIFSMLGIEMTARESFTTP